MKEITLPGRERLASKNSKDEKLVSFDRSKPMKTIEQIELTRERIAFQKALRAYEEWQEKHHAIQDALEQGATVEEGLYKAEIATQICKCPITEPPLKIVKLIIS